MVSRPSRSEHHAAVTRRLRLLGEELDAVRGTGRPAPGEAGRPEPGEPPGVAAPPGPDPVVPTPGRHAARRPRRAPGWLPETLRGRVALGPGPLAVVAVLVALGLGVTAWWVARSDSTTVGPVGPVAPPSTSAPALAEPASPAADRTAASVTVDVAGKVRRPGIAVLDAGARVVDALEAAGGVRRGVDLTGLNLARVLVDGEQVVVGVPVPAVAGSSGASPPSGTGPPMLVNINTADQAELESLPEVGPVTAQAILGWREDHGGFTSVSELLEVDGIGEATLDTIAPFVTV